jgi:hypothetical protein
MAAHYHHFGDNEWPFPVAVNTAAYTTGKVFNDEERVLTVVHTADGDWQFLGETTTKKKDLVIMCLGCIFERDRTVGEIAALPTGWKATRISPADAWVREEDVKPDVGLSGKLFSFGSKLLHLGR